MIPQLEQGCEDNEIDVKHESKILEERAEANLKHKEVPCTF